MCIFFVTCDQLIYYQMEGYTLNSLFVSFLFFVILSCQVSIMIKLYQYETMIAANPSFKTKKLARNYVVIRVKVLGKSENSLLHTIVNCHTKN